jgi:signal transduction histidine kinase/ActR/RegA family two-component response regulator
VRRVRLRTKLLLSLLAISAALTSATLLTVRYTVERRVRESISEDLRKSVNTYRSFARQREDMLARSAELLANLPNLRALMTTRDAATIQDGAAEVWRLSGADLLVLCDGSGKIMGLQASAPGLHTDAAVKFLRRSLQMGSSQAWWFGGGRLYEVWIQPIYFGAVRENTILGYLAVGYAIDDRTANELSNVVSSQVAFQGDGLLVATTLASELQPQFVKAVAGDKKGRTGSESELQLGRERYLATSVPLSSEAAPAVSLTVLESFDKATSFLNALNHVLEALGLLSVLAGSVLIFLISHTFTRPLSNLVSGVRALEHGDFKYPLETNGGDEVAEVTSAFDRMRANLKKTMEDEQELERRLRQAHKMEAVGRLAGGVAHDFNNLLTVIRGNAELLLEYDPGDPMQRRSAEQIQKASNRAASMTRQLLAFSRMQVLQPRLLDLNVIVSDLGKMLPRLIGEDIEFSFLPGPKLKPVKADPGQIEQVIMNLTVNSRDAMPEGGKLTIRTENAVLDDSEANKRPPMTAGVYVLLTVSDTGHGMDAETKAHIFEPFFTTKEVGKGTGLGLATVYGVVKQSGGFVWVESSPGQGTSFEIYLPQVLDSIALAEPEAKPAAVLRGTETILLVEDEGEVRELACEFLRASGYRVLEARDGIEAAEMAASHNGDIHVVVSDMVMPRMGGAALAEKLKVSRPASKVILMTGYSDYVPRVQRTAGPEWAMLQKPFSRESLVRKVHEVLKVDPAEKNEPSLELP